MGTVHMITTADFQQPEFKPAPSINHVAMPYPRCPLSRHVWDDSYEDLRFLLLTSWHTRERA